MNQPTISPEAPLTSESLIERLSRALTKDGDFPASAKVVNELKRLTSDPKTTANQITEVILREPSLGARVLALVNSTFYRRAKPIMTVSQAVVQIGMKPLADLCSGLVLLQKFVPAARRGGPFASCLQQTIVTSMLSSCLSMEQVTSGPREPGASSSDETGYLAGSLAELGTLLLGFYFPQVYETALKRASQKHVSLSQGIKEITGLSPLEISGRVLESLDLPPFYKQVLIAANDDTGQSMLPADMPAMMQAKLRRAAGTVSASRSLAEALVFNPKKAEVDRLLASTSKRLGIPLERLGELVSGLPQIVEAHCSGLDFQSPGLPEFLQTYDISQKQEVVAASSPTDPFSPFLEELRQAAANGEPTSSLITSVMEAIAWGLKFDRVLLMLVSGGKKSLQGRMLLGASDGLDPRNVERPIGIAASSFAPDNRAFTQSRPIFDGEPVLPGGWPLACLPIGIGTRAIGIVYADRIGGKSSQLTSKEQAAIAVLVEILDKSIGAKGSKEG